MGAAPEMMDEFQMTQEQRRDNDQRWFLDAATGQLKPEEDPVEEPRSRPDPVQVARRTYD